MPTNILEYLEASVRRVPEKIAFSGTDSALTYTQLSRQARAIGSYLHREGFYKAPVVIFMRKQPAVLAAFFGAVYAGCFYVPLDEEMPRHRIELIFRTLEPGIVICDEATYPLMADMATGCRCCLYSDIAFVPEDAEALAKIRSRQIDTDPVYVIFTSGSTGVPKGVAVCHRSLLDYVESLCQVMKFDENTVFGNQTPLHFDASTKDIYPTLKYGCTTHLIPKQLFMFPVKLVEYLNEKQINTVCWVVSALTMISSFRVLEKIKPAYLRTVAFVGEVFPMKQFRLWQEALPDTRFINLYGPTEITGVCCYYEVDRLFSPEEVLPIGKPLPNTDILLLDENDQQAADGQQGEICVRGTCVSLGYYRDPERTAQAFVQNPLNHLYPERIYRTGDLGKYNELGQLVFVSRKDNQIKHMGHRIELGEIEAIAGLCRDVQAVCCLFNQEKKKIVLFFTGAAEAADVSEQLRAKLPRYMVPHKVIRLDAMPLTPNGKVDRTFLKTQI